MKIYAISLIKNEADIIEANLLAASKWADKIYVFDNGSTDGTWEIVQSMASNIIVPYKSSPVPYRDSLRQEVFEYFRNELIDGDWICFKLDADEFYLDNPKKFLKKLPFFVSLVHGLNIEFQFTEENLIYENEPFDPTQFLYAKIRNTEQRFIKYRRDLVWNNRDSLPLHPGVSSYKLIHFAHYQFRNPTQIEKRLQTRKMALNSGYEMYWDRDLGKKWTDLIQSKNGLFKIDNIDSVNEYVKIANVKLPETFAKQTIKFFMHVFRIWP